MKHNNINCIIVDDEEIATKVLQNHLQQVSDFNVVGVYHSGVEAFLALDEGNIDVMFLDIQMPKMTGIAMLRMLKNPPLCVLTTAHRDYALEGFELDVVDYLLKPISLKRFLQTIAKIKRMVRIDAHAEESRSSSPQISSSDMESDGPHSVEEEKPDHIFVRSERAFVRIELSQLLYVEALKNHIRIVMQSGQTHISLMPISEFEAQLPPDDFVRIHRSFLLNISMVDKFDATSVVIGDKTLPIGRSYKEKAREALMGWSNS